MSTEEKARKILLKLEGFRQLSKIEKRNLIMEFAKKGKVVTIRAFDLVRTKKKINFLDKKDIAKNIDSITLIEMKSTDRELGKDFSRYFFGITMTEIIIAQSLKKQYKFVFVNIHSNEILELHLPQVFAKIKNLQLVMHLRF